MVSHRYPQRSKRPWLRWLLLGCVTVEVVAFGLAIRRTRPQTDWLTIVNTVPIVSLDPLKNTHEVVVPFRMWYGWIVVRAAVGGRPVDCMLDTGSHDCLEAPEALDLGGRRTPVKYQSYRPTARARPRPAMWVILPSLQLGGYRLRECPALFFDSDNHDSRDGVQGPVLGSSAFGTVVLTIDYRRRLLTLRPADRDLARLPLGPRDRLLDFEWTEVPGAGGYGVPAVRGTVAGLPARFALDTGAAADRVGLTSRALISAVARETKARTVLDRAAGKPAIEGVLCSVGGLIYRGRVDLTPGLFLRNEAILGSLFLQNYRVTVDFPHKKILLQWDPPVGKVGLVKKEGR